MMPMPDNMKAYVLNFEQMANDRASLINLFVSVFYHTSNFHFDDCFSGKDSRYEYPTGIPGCPIIPW